MRLCAERYRTFSFVHIYESYLLGHIFVSEIFDCSRCHLYYPMHTVSRHRSCPYLATSTIGNTTVMNSDHDTLGIAFF